MNSTRRSHRFIPLVSPYRPGTLAMKRYLPLLLVLIAYQVFHAYEVRTLDQRSIGTSESSPGSAEPKISGRLQELLSTRLSGERFRVWIHLADKGDADGTGYLAALDAAEDRLTPRARRRLALRSGRLAGWEDIPVHRPYLERIEELGGQILHVSRWINSASVSAAPEVIQRLSELPFVTGIEPVNAMRRPTPPVNVQVETEESAVKLRPTRTTRLDYGPSFVQMNQLQVPSLHDLGLSGQGVLVALFDTGFNLDHVAFDSLRTRVEAHRDFIEDHMGLVGFPFTAHGTQVLSTIGGYAPGQLVGPAFGASYLLASTEAVSFENEIEEDWWVAAMEWADSLGVDVISSSLGYTDWYIYEDMDGETAMITRAASIAADRGIVVVNAMGNTGGFPYEKMIAPADAEKVISVGAVDSAGRRAVFSSIGPTFDGRIKPDVMAMGESVYTVDPSTTEAYVRSDGTSYSTPLVAGVAALLLEAYPHWTPEIVQRVLRQTAGQAASPDTLNGYGIVHAVNALMTESRGTVREFTAESGPSGVFLAWTAGLEINLVSYRIERRDLPDGSFESLTSIPVTRAQDIRQSSNRYVFTDTDVQPGSAYEYRLQSVALEGFPLTASPVTVRITLASSASDTPSVVLYPNAPNPFATSTSIRFELTEPARVTLTIYNLLGRKVRVLVDETHGPGRHTRIWNGRDGDGRAVPSGVYFYRMTAGVVEEGGKMLLLR